MCRLNCNMSVSLREKFFLQSCLLIRAMNLTSKLPFLNCMTDVLLIHVPSGNMRIGSLSGSSTCSFSLELKLKCDDSYHRYSYGGLSDTEFIWFTLTVEQHGLFHLLLTFQTKYVQLLYSMLFQQGRKLRLVIERPTWLVYISNSVNYLN